MRRINIDDSLFQDFIYNYSELIDFLFEHSKRIALYCHTQHMGVSISDYVNELLDYIPNLLLKDAFLNIHKIGKQENEEIFCLEFTMDECSREWLLAHGTMYDFNNYYSRITHMPQNETIAHKNGWELYDPCFIDSKNRIIMNFNDGMNYTEIHEDYLNEFKKWRNIVIRDKKNKYKTFAKDFESAVENKDINIVERFSSDKYPYFLFMKVLDKSNIAFMSEFKYLTLFRFYQDRKNVRLFSKIIINKLLNEFNFDVASNLFRFYFFNDELVNCSIEKYYSELDIELFVKIFNRILINCFNNELWSDSYKVFSKIINLWDKKGIDNSLALTSFIKIKCLWEDEEALNKIIPDYSQFYGNKKSSLFELLHISIWDCESESRYKYLQTLKKSKRIYHYAPMLAWNSLYGIIGGKNYKEAFDMFLMVCKKHENNCYYIDCQYDLARCYLNGWGTEKNVEQAKYWFKKAAENGHPKAQEQLDLIGKVNQ